MSTHPPEWFQIVGPLTFSTAVTLCLYWQPQWIHRTFRHLVLGIENLASRRTDR